MHSHFLNYFSICLNCNSYLVWISFLLLLAFGFKSTYLCVCVCVCINIQQRKSTKIVIADVDAAAAQRNENVLLYILWFSHLLYCLNLFTVHLFLSLLLLQLLCATIAFKFSFSNYHPYACVCMVFLAHFAI